MASGLFSNHTAEAAIKHISKPKWLTGVTVRRKQDGFILELWNGMKLRIPNREKFKSTYMIAGIYDYKALNMLGDNAANFTMKVNNLDTTQCFSLSKPILINRIIKEGTIPDELTIKYDEDGSDCLIMRNTAEGVIIENFLLTDSEVIFNGIPVSFSIGPEAISKMYGKPEVLLTLKKAEDYGVNKSVNISGIIFTWGDYDTKYVIKLTVNVPEKYMLFEIIVH